MNVSKLYQLLLTVTLFALQSTLIPAAPGDLDTTFNTTGFARTRLGDGTDQIGAAAIQTDGKIVVAGSAFNGANYDFAVARYNTDGSLDTTFDTDGKVLTPIGGGNDSANAVAIQSDGKIVVAGSSNNGSNEDFAIVRYNADGSLDTTFDADGKQTTPVGTSNDMAYSAAILPNGKIIAAGSARNGSLANFAIVRYNADGSLDTTFGANGKVSTSMSANLSNSISAAVQLDGKIVLAGNSFTGSNYDFAVVRYDADGNLDTTFDGDGKVTTPVGTGSEFVYSAAIQTDGKIVAVGSANIGSSEDFAVVRYNADGSLDAAFDGDGKTTTPVGTGFDIARSVAVQTDGKIVAVGNYFNGVNSDFAVVRYNSNGSLDSSFDADGKAVTPIQASIDIGYAAAIQADGKIVAAGLSDNGLNNDFATVRYNTDGSLDNSFDADGKLITRELGSNANLRSIAVQTDGKIVAVGTAYNGTFDFAVVRYNADGSLDQTFGSAGKVVTPFSTTVDDAANAVAIQADGKIVVAGMLANAAFEFALVRYNSDGTLDTTFGSGGKITTPFTTHTDDGAKSIVIQPDGKIVAAGSAFNGGYDFAIARYNANGTLDATFDADGKVTTPIGTGNDYARSVKIQPDGKIIAAGESNNGSNSDFAVVRYNTNGSLDTTFDADGKVTTPIGTGNDSAYSAAIQPDGKIIAAGSSSIPANDPAFAIVRYNADGSLDNSFDTDGKTTTQIGPLNDYIASTAIQLDGKIVAAGNTFIDSTTYDFAVVRYNANGSLDAASGFGIGGIVKTNIGRSDVANSMALQSDGKIVLGGSSDAQFTVVRYLAGPDAGVSPPAVSKSFSPSSINVGAVSTLTLTFVNPSTNSVALTGVGITDAFPAGMLVNSVPGATNTCGGTLTASANANNIALSGGSISANGSCSVTVKVTATSAGNKVNTTGAVTSINGGTGETASATLNVIQETVTHSVSGTISYGIAAANQTPPAVASVNLSAAGASNISTASNSSGFYQLSELAAGGNYTVTLSKIAQTDVNGINSTDATRIQQHLVGLTTLTANQLIAADTDGNGIVNSTDATRIQQRLVGMQTSNIIGQWKFVPTNRQYNAITNNVAGENYQAILVGEVSGNWTAPSGFAETVETESLTFAEQSTAADIAERFEQRYEPTGNMNGRKQEREPDSKDNQAANNRSAQRKFVTVALPTDASSASGTVTTIPIFIGALSAETGIESFDFSVFFDPAVLAPLSVPATNTGTLSADCSVLSNTPTPGRVIVSGACAQALTNTNAGALINLRFAVIGDTNQPTTLSFTSRTHPSSAFQLNNGSPSVSTKNGRFRTLAVTASRKDSQSFRHSER